MGALQDEARRDTTPPKLKDAIDAADKVYFTEFRTLRNQVVGDLSAGRTVDIDMREWLKLTAAGRESVYMVAKTAFDLASAHAAEQFDTAERDFLAALALMVFFFGVGSLTVLYVIKGVVQPMTKIAEAMKVVAGGELNREIAFQDRPMKSACSRSLSVPRQRHRKAAIASRQGRRRDSEPHQVGLLGQHEPLSRARP